MPLSCVAVLPAYNEEGNIARVVADWNRELSRLFGDGYRMLIVNDGSRDNTGAMLDRLAREFPRLIVHHQPNGGHGVAVMNGYRIAVQMDTDYIFQTDSDDQFEAADFTLLWERRTESKFILGMRKHRNDSVFRIVFSKVANLLVYGIFKISFKDSNVPFRLMERGFLAEALPLVPRGAFAPNICLAVIAAHRKQPLLHIPVRHRARVSGKSIVSSALLRGAKKSLSDLLEMRKIL